MRIPEMSACLYRGPRKIYDRKKYKYLNSNIKNNKGLWEIINGLLILFTAFQGN